MSLRDRALAAFTTWFGSKGGVWQTTLITLAIVVLEAADRGLDPHAFMLMAVLTVYSAITQPALAHAGAVAAAHSEEMLERMAVQEAQIASLEQRILDLLAVGTVVQEGS